MVVHVVYSHTTQVEVLCSREALSDAKSGISVIASSMPRYYGKSSSPDESSRKRQTGTAARGSKKQLRNSDVLLHNLEKPLSAGASSLGQQVEDRVAELPQKGQRDGSKVSHRLTSLLASTFPPKLDTQYSFLD